MIVMTMGYVDQIDVLMVQPQQVQVVVQDQLRRPGVEQHLLTLIGLDEKR